MTYAILAAFTFLVWTNSSLAQTCVHREVSVSTFKVRNGKSTDVTQKRSNKETHYDGPGIQVQVSPTGYNFRKDGGAEVTVNPSGKIYMTGVSLLGQISMLNGQRPRGNGAIPDAPVQKTGVKKVIAGIPCEVYSVRQPQAGGPDKAKYFDIDERCLSFDQPASYFKRRPVKQGESDPFKTGLTLERKLTADIVVKGEKGGDYMLATTTKVDGQCPPAEYTSVPAGFREFKVPAK